MTQELLLSSFGETSIGHCAVTAQHDMPLLAAGAPS
jgi:hypothetical protein